MHDRDTTMGSRGIAAFGMEPAPPWVTIGWLVIFVVAFSALTVHLLQLG